MPCSGPMETATRFSFLSASDVLAAGVDPGAGVRLEAVEDEPLLLARVLHARLAQVVEDHRLEGDRARRALARRPRLAGRSSSVARTRCGDRLSTVNGPVDADALRVLVRLVVEQLGVGVAGDGRVDLLARHALADVGVVGDRLQGHVRDALVDEAAADVGCRDRGSAASADSGVGRRGLVDVPLTSISLRRLRANRRAGSTGYFAAIRRVRARASATRLVSIVIHRRPHCSATYAVVPDPHVGSSTRSPGSVVMRRQRSMTFVVVWTT